MEFKRTDMDSKVRAEFPVVNWTDFQLVEERLDPPAVALLPVLYRTAVLKPPLPSVMSKSTDVLATGLPLESVTKTTGAGIEPLPAVTLGGPPITLAIVAAAPAVMLKPDDVPAVSPDDVAESV